ncbi:MAG TPA: TPM domain-containing protein [Thermoanaerobacterales bacterium]|jgi:uncharacterized protein|nr:TPM domain-containing protein [Thermoanaerobacterales bacterium]
MINNITPIKRKKFIRLLIMSMIVLSLILINSNIALAQSAPSKPDVNLYIFDYANLIDDSDEQEMRKIAKVLDDKTKAQIVVVTVNDLSQMELEDYALKLFRSWGIGDKQKNNGLLILVNKESLIKAQRGRIRIEVGYGLEGAINDGKAGAILDNFALPAFEKGEYSRGIKDTFLAASSEVAREYGLDIESEELSNLQDYSVKDDDKVSLGKLLGIIIFIIIIFLLPRKPRRRYYRRGPFNGPFFGPFGGGGGFGGGGFGGFGGGGFGGGRSGGGGASR